MLCLKQNAGEFLRQRGSIFILNLQKDFVDVLLAVAGEPMIFQRQDINIANRLQIIDLQKVFYTFGQLGGVFAEGAGKMISRYRPAGSVILMDCRCLVALVTQEKYACER